MIVGGNPITGLVVHVGYQGAKRAKLGVPAQQSSPSNQDASELFAKNVLALLKPFFKEGELVLDPEDEVIGRFIEVTRVPALLQAQAEDIQAGLRQLTIELEDHPETEKN